MFCASLGAAVVLPTPVVANGHVVGGRRAAAPRDTEKIG